MTSEFLLVLFLCGFFVVRNIIYEQYNKLWAMKTRSLWTVFIGYEKLFPK